MGSEMCIRDRYRPQFHLNSWSADTFPPRCLTSVKPEVVGHEFGGLGSGSSPVRLFVSVPRNDINWVMEVGA